LHIGASNALPITLREHFQKAGHVHFILILLCCLQFHSAVARAEDLYILSNSGAQKIAEPDSKAKEALDLRFLSRS